MNSLFFGVKFVDHSDSVFMFHFCDWCTCSCLIHLHLFIVVFLLKLFDHIINVKRFLIL